MRRGFTIIELLVVIAVIGILGAIVTTAALGSLRNSRDKRADMMAMALEQGIAAYYAQNNKWPDVIESVVNSGDGDVYEFSPSESDEIFYQVVGRGFGKGGKKSVLVDATALFVANKSKIRNGGKGCFDNHKNPKAEKYCGNQGCIGGVDFTMAVAKSGKHHIRLADMAYGYQGTQEGKFCRFKVYYNRKTDAVTVTK